jgi:hypothetical protein
MRIKIASITGDSARLVAKAQEDTGQVIFKVNSTISARKILDVFIEIEDCCAELIKEGLKIKLDSKQSSNSQLSYYIFQKLA